MSAGEKTCLSCHAKRFEPDTERAAAGVAPHLSSIQAVETYHDVKAARRLKLMKAPLQRFAGGFQEDASSGCRECVGEASDLGRIQRLGAGNPNDGRPKSRNQSAGLSRAFTRKMTAD